MIYSFTFEGENTDGDLLTDYFELEGMESFKEACEFAEKEAIQMLEDECGGHIDIFDGDGKFINDVEV